MVPDLDPIQTSEWVESIRGVLFHQGRERAEYLAQVVAQTLDNPVNLSSGRTNTIPPSNQPPYPGDQALEERIEAITRWNAAVMVHRANQGSGLGGHIGTYASASTLYEVALNWHIKGRHHESGGDHVFFQPHASPGIYARSYLEGRFTEADLDRFRQETIGGLSSYPHPRSMDNYWEYPTASMGLGPLNAIHQARFDKYLGARSLTSGSDRTIWSFVGDGEMAEPEAVASLQMAGRERLDNLIFVVNCNLQQLDGPVLGNGSVIAELERLFQSAGWDVYKVLWGSELDSLVHSPKGSDIVAWLSGLSDGELQSMSQPEIQSVLGARWTDSLPRGGHDRVKLHAAFSAARLSERPSVVLAHTVKGFGLGSSLESSNAIHGIKTLTDDALITLAGKVEPIVRRPLFSGEKPEYAHPGEDSEEAAYVVERRLALGGPVPERRVAYRAVIPATSAMFDEAENGYVDRSAPTTRVMVRLLRDLIKDDNVGERIVPIVPDEARTFGLDGLFKSRGIYRPGGSTYDASEEHHLLTYVESSEGQILHVGINEAAAMASFHAAGSSYTTHGLPMIPFYFFYSMFGFQRTGDLIWSAADQRARGFLIGATAGGTTLNGEGLQHQDRHSPLLAATNPAVKTFDPAFAFELGAIIREGLRSMYGEGPEVDEDVIFYLTVYNEAIEQRPRPTGLTDEEILGGIYRLSPSEGEPMASLLASGVAMAQALEAQQYLRDIDIDVDVWSVTSWVELHRDAMAASAQRSESRLAKVLGPRIRPFVAVSDWSPSLPTLIAPWLPGDLRAVGPSGFGMSDTREALRALYGMRGSDVAKVAAEAVHGPELRSA